MNVVPTSGAILLRARLVARSAAVRSVPRRGRDAVSWCSRRETSREIGDIHDSTFERLLNMKTLQLLGAAELARSQECGERRRPGTGGARVPVQERVR